MNEGGNMNLYFELLKKPVFNMEDVNVFYNNIDSACIPALAEKLAHRLRIVFR